MVWFVVLTTIYNRINSNDLLLYVQCAVLVWKLELISFYTVLQWIIVGMSHLVFWRVLALSCWFALVSSRYVRWFAFEKKCYLVEVPSLCYNLVFVAAKKCKTIHWLSFKPIVCMQQGYFFASYWSFACGFFKGVSLAHIFFWHAFVTWFNHLDFICFCCFLV